jgi:sigma-E factor negative regulatory protein RseA
MTDRIREQMSALLDGELPQDEVGLLVRRLERDAVLRQAFGHYVLAGEVLRSPGGPLASSGFAAAVGAAIDEAPAQLDRNRPDARAEGSWWSKPAFATAVAATAAIFAVLIVQTGVQPPPASVAASALRQAQQAFAGIPVVHSSSPTAASSQRLAGYLMAHSQFASPIGRRNVWSGVLAADPSISRVSYESAGTP